MRFLCVTCNQAMTMKDAIGPGSGSVALVYACAGCGAQIALLTNPQETQVVQSLGVRLGPDGEPAAGKCPFTGILHGLEEQAAAGEAAGSPRWSASARQRLEEIPSFARQMARTSIEEYARHRGHTEITERVLDEMRDHAAATGGRFGTAPGSADR